MMLTFCGHMSRLVGKPTICIGENKGADQLRGNREADHAKLISAFVFATRIVQFLFYLNPKFQASSSFLCLYSPVCVGPVRKPHCWFSHERAHMLGSPGSLKDQKTTDLVQATNSLSSPCRLGPKEIDGLIVPPGKLRDLHY